VSRRDSNALRKDEGEDMATPVQEISSMPAIAGRPKTNETVDNSVLDSARGRAVVPMVLLAVLVFVFFASPYLPTGIREYVSALVK